MRPAVRNRCRRLLPSASSGAQPNGQSNPGPAAPTIQSADGSSGTQVVIDQWSARPGATSYILQREDPARPSFTQIGAPLTATTYNDTSVTAGRYLPISRSRRRTAPVRLSLQHAGVGHRGHQTGRRCPPPTPTNLQASTATGISVILTCETAPAPLPATTSCAKIQAAAPSRPSPPPWPIRPTPIPPRRPGMSLSVRGAGQKLRRPIGRLGAGDGHASPRSRGHPATLPANVQASTASSATSVVLTWNPSAGAATLFRPARRPPAAARSRAAHQRADKRYHLHRFQRDARDRVINIEVFAMNTAGSSPTPAFPGARRRAARSRVA